MMSVSAITLPIVFILCLLPLGIAIALHRWRPNSRASFALRIVIAFSTATMFVHFGMMGIGLITDGRGAPEETAPWLIVIALVGVGVYLSRPTTAKARRARNDALPVANIAPSGTLTHPPVKTPEIDDVSGPNPLPRQDSSPSKAIFISYRRDDSSDVTGRIYDRLCARFSAENIFKDVDSIALGVDFRTQISTAVGRCELLLAVIGRDWLQAADASGGRRLDDSADFVRIELEAALSRGIPVVPILVRGAGIPRDEELPASLSALAYRNGIAVRPDPDFHQDMARLIRGIEEHLTNQR